MHTVTSSRKNLLAKIQNLVVHSKLPLDVSEKGMTTPISQSLPSDLTQAVNPGHTHLRGFGAL